MTETFRMIVSLYFTVAMLVARVAGHGYLLVPPARNTAWMTDPSNWEPNYNANQQFCGGFVNQWQVHDGKCGICGDPYQGPYDHEAGGIFAKPHRNVTRCYNTADDVMDIHVVITAHHKGYFEFRICEHNNMATRADQSCFDNGILLTVHETGQTRFDINNDYSMDYYFHLNMPRGVTCTQCILQWKYNTGNNWGCDDTGCGSGLGPQEQFINCADIAILENCATDMTTSGTRGSTASTSSASTSSGTAPTGPTSADTSPSATTAPPTAAPPTDSTFQCKGVGDWTDPFTMEWMCTNICYHNYNKCPWEMCVCNRAP